MEARNDSLTDRVDQLFARWDRPDSPGAALAVLENGSVVYRRGYGCANLEYGISITPSTVFHAASVSKQFTAWAIAVLGGEGKLSLDDDIRRYLPEVPELGNIITIRHLVHHTSGLRDQWDLLVLAGWRMDDVITREHILKMVGHQQELNFEPGAQHLYCNTGYTLMAEIVARVSGQSFREYTNEHIFGPLDMTDSFFFDDHEEIVRNRAYSYSPGDEEGSFKKSVLSYANVGATSLFTTVDDLIKWAQNFEDGRVGGAEVLEQVHQRGVLNDGRELEYAFGQGIGEHRGFAAVSHSGGDAAYRSHLVRFPERRLAIAILSNLGTLNPSRLALKVADVYLAPELTAEAEREPAVSVDPALYDAIEGNYSFDMGILRVSKQDDGLVAEVEGLPIARMQVKPLSEDRFYIPEVDVEVSVHRSEAGEVNRLGIHVTSQEMSAIRIEPLSLTPEELAELAGSYYSRELGTTYSLAVEDDRLVLKHRRREDVPLCPTLPDRFAGEKSGLGELRFIREESGKVTGFRLSTGRVKNLRFRRHGKPARTGGGL